jgi:BetI-type transcriptional repressor, C-terminal
VALMFELFTSGRRNPEIAAEFAELQRATRTRLAELLAARQEQGAVRLADEPEAVAAVLLSLADGFALRLLGEPANDHGPALRAATAAARTLLTHSD